MMRIGNIFKFIFAVLVCFSTGGIGSAYTVRAFPEWYQGLTKPSFSPPDWVFGPVWTILYFMMGVAAYLVWKKGLKETAVRNALVVFLIQLSLNGLWSFLFFGLRSPLYGLIDIVLLWIMILVTLGQFAKISIPAAVLLIPYAFWVTFASGLNLGVFLLNR